MTESERILRRQAEWQRTRQHAPWPEKIRQAERIRSSIEAIRKGRLQPPRRMDPASGSSGPTDPA